MSTYVLEQAIPIKALVLTRALGAISMALTTVSPRRSIVVAMPSRAF